MPLIEIETNIKADIEICFDLSRSIGLHELSTRQSNERAIAGVTDGLIGPGQSVTWEATHFGIRQRLTSSISKYDRPHYFQDVMVKGAFHSFTHDHYFKQHEDFVIMKDKFHFKAPLGFLGSMAEWLFLTAYMRKLLTERNRMVREVAEGGKFKQFL